MLVLLLLGDLVDDLVGNTKVLDVISFDVDFWQTHEFISFRACLHDFFEGEVHPRIAHDQVSVERLSILQLDQHGVALSGIEQSEGKHGG